MPRGVVKKKEQTGNRKRVHFAVKDAVAKPKSPPKQQSPEVAKAVDTSGPRGQVGLPASKMLEAPANKKPAPNLAMFKPLAPFNPHALSKMKRFKDQMNVKASDMDISIKFDQIGIPRRRSTLSLYSNRDVIDVLSNIQEAQKQRERFKVINELGEIKRRIHRTLENVGMESDSDDDEDELEVLPGGAVKFPPIFDTRAERDKMQQRNYIINKMEDFEVKALVRKQYLTELACWFEENLNLSSDMVTPEEMKNMIRDAQELHCIISDSLKTFIANGEEVVEKGKALLKETSKIIEEKKAQMAKKTKKERMIVYDDKTLLADPIKWESAVKNIISVFEDCQRMIKNLMFKHALRLGQRQFDYLMVAADKRYKDLDDKKRLCSELHGKLHTAKVQNDKLSRELDDMRKKMHKVTTELHDAKDTLDKLSEKNKELSRKIVELNSKIRFLDEELRKKLRTPTPPPTPSPPPEPEKIIVKVIDSATELQLRTVEQELEEAQKEIEKLIAEQNLLLKSLSGEKELNKQLKERVTELESIEIPPAAPTPVVPSPVVEHSPENIQDKDASYYKTLMTGMKKDFATEMEKVKAHIQREKVRGEAGQRKMELQHKDHLSAIQKDTIRMLRAIMHFRDHMLACLQKETLVDQAQALHDMGNLVKDKFSPDPKEVLAMIVGTVIEYLHSLEGILSNSFLAMRVMMKQQVEKQVEQEMQLRIAKEKQEKEAKKVVKDIKIKQKEMSGATKDLGKLAKRLKKAKNKLRKYQKTMDDALPSTDKRYNDLLARYKQIIKMYKNMQKEMENLQSDFHDTMQRKLEEKETMVISQIKMELKQQRVVNEEQLKLSISDLKENLRLLSKAYGENKISKDLHSMATAMITKTLEIPQQKLRNLFEQYIAYRAVEESKERVQKLLKDDESELAIDTRKDMHLYLDQLDDKYRDSLNSWRKQMRELDIEKRDINRKIYKLFNELLLETGVLLIHPLLSGTNKQNILTRAAATVTRKQMKEMLFKGKRNVHNLLGLPDGIQGSSICQTRVEKPSWPQPPSEPVPGVTAPHMLAYEVNRPRLLAQRSLKGVCKRALAPGRTESFTITDHNYMQFIRDIPYKWTDHIDMMI